MRNFILSLVVVVSSILGSLAIMALASPAADNSVPVGTIIAWGGDAKSVPADWMLCNGKVMKRKQYPTLFEAIGTAWGAPNSKKFNLPDLRGRFIRGVDAGSGRDPDVDSRTTLDPQENPDGVGSVQDDSFQNHSHFEVGHIHPNRVRYWLSSTTGVTSGSKNIVQWTSFWSDSETESANAGITGAVKYGTKAGIKKGEETRPENAYVNFIIKVR